MKCAGCQHENRPGARFCENCATPLARACASWGGVVGCRQVLPRVRLLGDIAAHPDGAEAETAGTHYRQALALAEELGRRPLAAHCHLGLGTLHARGGGREQARERLTSAVALFREMAMPYWSEQADRAAAQLA